MEDSKEIIAMRRTLYLFMTLIILFLGFNNAFAQQIEISSSLNPVGSGARAMGMGGAFIGVADDATAASWNPAGLVQLEKPEISMVYSYFNRSQTYNSSTHPEIEGENLMNSNGINYGSAAYPFVLFKRNMIVSINYQRLYEMNKEVNFKYTWDLSGDKLYDNIEFKQKGYLYALSPALAVQITPQFYLGVTLNFWGNYLGDNGWDNTYKSSATGTLAGYNVTENVDWSNDISFRGTNANLGFLWNIYGPFTIGGVYKTRFDARLKKETTFTQGWDWPGESFDSVSSSETAEDFTMKMPASYGLGLAYRHSDAWTIALDVYRTEWSKFSLIDSAGNETNPIYGAPLNEGRLEDTIQIRLGTEYLFIKEKSVIPVRFGIFYDPEPAKGSPDDYYGFSIGTGFSTKKMSLDAAYQYRTGKNVTGDIPGVEGSNADITQHSIMMSVIYYF